MVGWILGEVNRDEELLSLCVDIADIDTALVGKEDPVALLMEKLVFDPKIRTEGDDDEVMMTNDAERTGRAAQIMQEQIDCGMHGSGNGFPFALQEPALSKIWGFGNRRIFRTSRT